MPRRAWLALALATAGLYGALAARIAFSGSWIIQDDVRQHVFWMERFVDPGAFPGDWIADYHQAIAPPGFALLYRVAAAAGVDPLFFAKVLPVAIGVLTAAAAFALATRLHPDPFGAFAAAVLLAQSLALKDDVVSGTPRAFAALLLLGFAHALVGGGRLRLAVWLVLAAGLFPPMVLVMVAVLGLRALRGHFGDLALGLAALALAVATQAKGYGPVLTRAVALGMPELQAGGRHYFFFPDAW
ncbi:MAG TPA: hypothetical protein VKA21_16325, partial [Candidatus Binatia bacterium]|nr:hypothetical protein [Candidatus Binatia bacterium]